MNFIYLLIYCTAIAAGSVRRFIDVNKHHSREEFLRFHFRRMTIFFHRRSSAIFVFAHNCDGYSLKAAEV